MLRALLSHRPLLLTILSRPQVRLAAAYAGGGTAGGILLPFLPAWLDARGLSPEAIGFIIGAGALIRIVAGPLAGAAADAWGDRRQILAFLCAGATIAYLGLHLAPNFAAIFGAAFLASTFFFPTGAIMDAITIRHAFLKGFDYGRVRLWASVAFVAANLGGGWFVAVAGPGPVVLVVAAALAWHTAAAFWLPPEGEGLRTAFAPALARTIKDAAPLVRTPVFILFVLAGASIQATHAFYYAFGTLHFQALGYGGEAIGGLWAFGVILEIMLFSQSRRVQARFRPSTLIALGGSAGIVRWAILALDPALPLLVVAQGLHALTFGATHLGAMYFLQAALPDRLAASGQSVYAACAYGIFAAAVSWGAGPLFAAFGGRGYIAMSLICACGIVAALALEARWNGRVIETRPGEA